MVIEVILGLSDGELKTVNSFNHVIKWYPQKEVNPHLLISGCSGSGKTETLKVICHELKRQNIPLLIFDFHNDFLSFADIVINEKNVKMHPLQILPGEKPLDVVYKVSSILKNTFGSITDVQEGTIREAMKQFYFASGIKDLRIPLSEKIILLPFADFINYIEKASADQRTKGSLKVKLDILFDYELFDAHSDSIDFDSLLSNITIFQLKNAPSDDVKRTVTELMLNKLIQYSYHLEQSNDIRLFCIIDEAHRMVYPGSPLDTLFREARKYGIGVILASQRATDFNETILANASSIISLKQNLKKDARHIAKNRWADEDQLLNLDTGHGFIRLPKTSKTALALSIIPLKERIKKKSEQYDNPNTI